MRVARLLCRPGDRVSCSSGKIPFSSKAEAKRRVRFLRRQEFTGGSPVKHAYCCPECGYWHMTSQASSAPSAGQQGPCRACKTLMLWVLMPSGKLNPLDVGEVTPQSRKGVIAFNPATGGGRPVTVANEAECAALAEKGVTFHLSHFATCPERQRFKRGKE